ncbi:hypothetical protein Turpa_3562 [Turneriella parva DSM 21527]|uniref:Uncharacterized protein n=2 Tax=Turneriella TaxID=338321 RepID=I4BA90_TURPD|nr:hypothetical protein Turpa_3562 [Turneriella parva DSM 21527]
MDNKRKHLELISNIITRMGSNSFAIKTWSTGLTTGILVLSLKEKLITFGLYAAIPITLFWFLDTFYLRQERLYRKLYDEVRVKKEKQIDFSMKTGHLFDEVSYCGVLFSITIFPFYLVLALTIGFFAILSLIPAMNF